MKKLEILYEDANIIIVNKPEGLLTAGFNGFHGRTAESILEQILRKNGKYSAKYRPLCVHRLDRETSGVMMFATNERAQKIIMDEWHRLVTSRKYIALAETPDNFIKYGILPEKGIIEDRLSYNAYNIAYVAHSKVNKNDSKTRSNRKEISARTHFHVLKSSKEFTLFELELDTGRKNQIRAHLAGKGYPIAGDENYRCRSNPFERLCLHAQTLEYTDPWTGQLHKFEIPHPPEWDRVIDQG